MNKKTQKAKNYNSDNYTKYSFRVRNGSKLGDKLDAYVETGEYSVNFLITKLLCEHFGVELPHKYYEHRVRGALVDDEQQ